MSVRYIWSKSTIRTSYSFKDYGNHSSPIENSCRAKNGDGYFLALASKPTVVGYRKIKYSGNYRMIDELNINSSSNAIESSSFPYITYVCADRESEYRDVGLTSYPSAGNTYNGTFTISSNDVWIDSSLYEAVTSGVWGGKLEYDPGSVYQYVCYSLDSSAGYPGSSSYKIKDWRVAENEHQGSFLSWVSSSSPSAYPNYDVQGSYFYESETQNIIDPSGIEISGKLIPGSDAKIVITPSSAAQGNQYGNISYNYECRYDDSGSWNSVGSSSDTFANFTVEKDHLSVKVRVKAKDDIGFESSDYVESSSYSIASLSNLVISNYSYGEDGNIGKVTKDIEFYISEDGSSEYTVQVYNGNYVYSFTATSNTKYYINILDLMVGSGEGLKFVFVSKAGASSEKSFIYTKDAQDFPSVDVAIGIIRLNGKDSYPMTVSEAVRTPGGSTLDVYLSNLVGKVNDLSSNPPDYRERNVLMDYSDPDGSGSFTQSINFTAYKGSAFAMLLDFDFSGPDRSNLMCVGVTPESWNSNCIRFYVVNSSTYGFTAHIFAENPIHVTVDQNISGHHRLVFRCKCQVANSVSAWLDGKNIIENAGNKFYAGSWSMSNAEGSTRFKGTYNEVSILKPYLTDEEYLEISKVE